MNLRIQFREPEIEESLSPTDRSVDLDAESDAKPVTDRFTQNLIDKKR